jgi:hypothetical protein
MSFTFENHMWLGATRTLRWRVAHCFDYRRFGAHRCDASAEGRGRRRERHEMQQRHPQGSLWSPCHRHPPRETSRRNGPTGDARYHCVADL